jgi:hypothetical protein
MYKAQTMITTHSIIQRAYRDILKYKRAPHLRFTNWKSALSPEATFAFLSDLGVVFLAEYNVYNKYG